MLRGVAAGFLLIILLLVVPAALAQNQPAPLRLTSSVIPVSATDLPALVNVDRSASAARVTQSSQEVQPVSPDSIMMIGDLSKLLVGGLVFLTIAATLSAWADWRWKP